MNKKIIWGTVAGAVVIIAAGTAWHFTQNPYAKNAKLPIDQQALYSDGTAQFQSPMEPAKGQPVTVQLRAQRGNVTSAELHIGNQTIRMDNWHSDALFDYFRATVPGADQPTAYYFRVINSLSQPVYYSRYGASTTEPDNTTAFYVYPGFQTPEWSKGAVLYQIFVDRFANGDPSNDVVDNEYMYDGKPAVKVKNWNQPPDPTAYETGGNRTREFYGGDLQGVIDKLSYLKSLGVEGIYLNPIFVSPSNHKYDTQDFEHVDPHFGKIVKDGGNTVNPNADPTTANKTATQYQLRTTDTANLQASDDLLATLIDAAHKQGIKVILDGVFNHSGTFNKWFDKEHLYSTDGAFETQNSPFHDYYTFTSGSTWPNNNSYESWNGFNTLPKLAYEQSAPLVKAIYGVGQKWVSPPYQADGWRLDAAADVGHNHDYNLKFWNGFRTAVKGANPQAFIFGEYYDNPGEYLTGEQWDSVMNYTAFFDPISHLLTGMEKHSQSFSQEQKDDLDGFTTEMQQRMSEMPYGSLYSAMNELDNHDFSRFLTRTNGQSGDTESQGPQQASQGVDKGILRQAAMMQFTWPGDPTIYYGDEAGLTGWTDPDSRRAYPWGQEDTKLVSFYQALGQLHKDISALRDGSFKEVYKRDQVYAYGRFDATTKAVTIVNVSDKQQLVKIPVWQLGAQSKDQWHLALRSQEDKLQDASVKVMVQEDGTISYDIAPHTAAVFTSADGVTAPMLK